jgi:DNA repair exonuclease SbcCD ATPase subunit
VFETYAYSSFFRKLIPQLGVISERSKSVNKSKKKTSSSSAGQKAEKSRSEALRGKQESEAESVDKIRDILFGHQMRDYEKRFARLEERLLSEIKELREATSKQLESVEAFIKKEVELLNQQLKAEQAQRAEAAKALSKDLESNIRTVSKRIEKQDEKQNKDSKDLRQQLLDQTKSLSELIRNKHQESSQALQNNVAELRAEKMDRSALSQLFVEMALRMSDELADKLNAELGDITND